MKRSGSNGAMMSSKAHIPKGWRPVRLGDAAEVNPRRPRLSLLDDKPVTFLPMAAIAENSQGIIARESRPYFEVSTGYTYFEENDFLFSKITPCLQNGKHALATDLKGGFGFGSTEFHVVRACSCFASRFMFRVLTQAHIIDRCAKSFTGTAGQQQVQPETLKDLPILLPPLAEQRAIAAVLDSIDDAIEGTEAVIAATEQLRDCLLHQLLTRGVPGWHTEWKEAPGLGTIPADWEVVRLGEVCEVNKLNWNPSDSSSISYLDLTAVVAPGELSAPREIVSEEAPSRARRKVHSGDILVSTVRPNLRGFARVREASANLVASTGFAVLTPVANVDGSLIYHNVMTERFASYLENATTGQAYPAVRPSDVADFRLPLPPLAEQQAIAGLLDGVDLAIGQAKHETNMLKLLKDSTADALLTGRVRVGSK